MLLSDKVVVVTGATGMAAAATTAFLAEGAHVFVISLDAGDCEILAAGLDQPISWAAADLRDDRQTGAAFARVVDERGRIDGLFAVAGGSGRPLGDGPVDDLDLSAWDATLSLNLTPPFLAAREATRQMLGQTLDAKGNRGSILLMSSVLATSPSDHRFATHAYAAAKGGIESLTIAMAARYAGDRIRVNAIAPGLVRTPMSTRAQSDPELLDFISRKQPLVGAMLEPDDISGLAALLLSDRARAITGQVIAIDGGWSIADPSS